MSTTLTTISGLSGLSTSTNIDNTFTVGEVLQSIIDRHGLHFTVSVEHSSPSSDDKHHVPEQKKCDLGFRV